MALPYATVAQLEKATSKNNTKKEKLFYHNIYIANNTGSFSWYYLTFISKSEKPIDTPQKLYDFIGENDYKGILGYCEDIDTETGAQVFSAFVTELVRGETTIAGDTSILVKRVYAFSPGLSPEEDDIVVESEEQTVEEMTDTVIEIK